MAFENLTEKISSAFKKLRSQGRLTEADVKAAMREIRMALLEADVNFKVTKDFIRRLKLMKTLDCVRPGESVTVQRLQGQGPVKRRIMDMGITKGTIITVRKVAPLGDPLEINLRNYELSIRKEDAKMVEVQ